MTHADIAELRGEIFGLKIALINCLGLIATLTDDPTAHLDAILNQAVEGIAKATNDQIKPAHIQTFRAAAAGIMLQLVDGAKVTAAQEPGRLSTH